MTNELKFAETVIVVDAAYLNKVTGDLSKHFEHVLERKLPKADLPVLFECVTLDGGITVEQKEIHIVLIYDEDNKQLAVCNPSDLAKEMNHVAFKSFLGEYVMGSFEPSGMATREDLFLETLEVMAAAQEVKNLLVIPDETAYGEKVPAILNKLTDKERVAVFSMNPPQAALNGEWISLGFAVLHALGIKSDDLR